MPVFNCGLPPDNAIYFKLGALFFLVYLVLSLLSGCVRFRSSRTYRADTPVQYWIMIAMIGFMLSWAAYPVTMCNT